MLIIRGLPPYDYTGPFQLFVFVFVFCILIFIFQISSIVEGADAHNMGSGTRLYRTLSTIGILIGACH